MPLKTIVNNTLGLFGLKMGKTVSSLGNKLAGYGINKEDYKIENGNITFNRLNVTLPYEKAYPVLEEYESALKLTDKKRAVFSVDNEKNLNIEIDNTRFVINDEEELFILTEVFLEGSYNLLSPTNKKIAVIDIGMNVGITSLFYASKNQVEKVFSFEPFTPTYNMALNNIKLNSSFSHKLQPSNFGLAKEEQEMQVSFSLKQKGRMGLSGLPQKSTMIKDNFTQQTIQLKPVKEQFISIKEKVKDNFVVCKMDCEGAEYELIDTLYDAQLLSLPDVYFIEWHYKSPDDIIAKLVECNYHVIGTTFRPLHSGMIYALKSNI